MRMKRLKRELPAAVTVDMLRANYYAMKEYKGIKNPKSFLQVVRGCQNTESVIIQHAKWGATPQGITFFNHVCIAIREAAKNAKTA